MSIRPLRILVIYYHPTSEEESRTTIRDHMRVLEFSDTPHEITYYNAYEDAPFWDTYDTSRLDPPKSIRGERFDVVIIHYTFLSGCIIGPAFYRWKHLYDWIARLEALRVAFPQDEGNCAEILEEWLIDLEVHIVFSVHYRPNQPLYPTLRHHARIEHCLPGYINAARAKEIAPCLKPIAERNLDIVYRARRLPHWFGRSGLRKCRVAEVVRERADALGLHTDISTRIEDVIRGRQWLNFIASSRAVIGVQGGYSAIDWRGEIKARIERWMTKEPALSFEEVDRRLPPGWDDYSLLTVTPRHFEAIVAKTAQILIEGDYRGVIRPHEHYLPVKPDFSNVDETLEQLRDHHRVQEMVDRTYEEVYRSGRYSYTTFARKIERVLEEELSGRSRNGASMASTQETTSTETALERALVAERHRNALLELKLMEMSETRNTEAGRMAEQLGETLASQIDRIAENVDQSTVRTNKTTRQELRAALKRAVFWLGLGLGIALVLSAASLVGVIVLLVQGD